MALQYVFILTVFAAASVAQEFVTPKYDEVNNETTIVEIKEPISSALRQKKSLLTPLLDHISFVSQAAQKSASEARENTDAPRMTICNYRANGDDWTEKVNEYFRQRSWGDVDENCVTDVYGAGVSEGVVFVGSSDEGSDSRTIFDAVRSHADGVNSIAKRAARNADMGWYSKAIRATGFEYSVRTQNCVHDYAGFVRRGGEWFIAERITNEDKDLTLGEEERKFIHEYVRVADGELRNAIVQVRVKDDDETKFEFENGTTSITETAGPVTASEFGERFGPENTAVQEALRAGEHSTQQASDATTPSNIAILALPLAMNVVPVALIADVNTVGMLVYTLLTDVLTSIPLLIKGVEVLLIGVNTNVAVVTRITGANVEDGNKAGEVWVAECRANGDLTSTGVALIVVAVGFMVGGVIAEIVAKKWVKRRGNVGKASAGLVMAGVVGRGVGRNARGDKNV